ncbi:MAG: hypothetical protein AAGG50_06740 [Bacteroidota bacterium]
MSETVIRSRTSLLGLLPGLAGTALTGGSFVVLGQSGVLEQLLSNPQTTREEFLLVLLVLAFPFVAFHTFCKSLHRLEVQETGMSDYYQLGSIRWRERTALWTDVTELDILPDLDGVANVVCRLSDGSTYRVGGFNTRLREIAILAAAQVPQSYWSERTIRALRLLTAER